jgi:uncharacterized protein (TIGR03067 family)
MRNKVIARLAVVIGAFVLLASGTPPIVKGQDKPTPPKWEFRAVSFGSDEKENTKKLNDLATETWEYVGPIGNGMVAFRRAMKPILEKTELEKFQGTWVLVSTARIGKVFINDDKTRTITFSGKKWVEKRGEKVIQGGTFQLDDVAKDPKQWTILSSITDPPQTGFGIYQFDGDILKYCRHDELARRPTDFTTKDGDGRFCHVWKRANP